jgi:hypothetical protein
MEKEKETKKEPSKFVKFIKRTWWTWGITALIAFVFWAAAEITCSIMSRANFNKWGTFPEVPSSLIMNFINFEIQDWYLRERPHHFNLFLNLMH